MKRLIAVCYLNLSFMGKKVNEGLKKYNFITFPSMSFSSYIIEKIYESL
jgi:hypothetical protein